MNGRIYDPILGRFLQADPLIQDLGNPQSLNRYTYVFNNPLAYTDPSGYGVLGKYGAQILNFATAWLSSGLYDAGYTNAALWVSVGGNAVSGWLASDSSTGALLGAFNGAAAFAVGSTTAGNGQSQISNRESKEGARSAPGGFRYWVSGSNFGSGIVPATLESGSSSQGTFVADSNLYNGVENVLKSMRKIPTFEELEKLALKRFPGFEWRVGRGGGSEFYPGTNERVFYPEKTDSSLKNPK